MKEMMHYAIEKCKRVGCYKLTLSNNESEKPHINFTNLLDSSDMATASLFRSLTNLIHLISICESPGIHMWHGLTNME